VLFPAENSFGWEGLELRSSAIGREPSSNLRLPGTKFSHWLFWENMLSKLIARKIINRTWGGCAAEFKGKRHVGTRSECAFAQKGFARICRKREPCTKQ